MHLIEEIIFLNLLYSYYINLQVLLKEAEKNPLSSIILT